MTGGTGTLGRLLAAESCRRGHEMRALSRSAPHARRSSTSWWPRRSRHGRVEVAGPEVADARAPARTWRTVTGARAAALPVPLPGKLGRALRDGALTASHPDVRGSTTFAAWLAAQEDGRDAVSSGRASRP